jgi:hypothetical protein
MRLPSARRLAVLGQLFILLIWSRRGLGCTRLPAAVLERRLAERRES